MAALGLNMHAMTRSVITGINPDVEVTILRSAGWEVNAQYEQVPTWAPPVKVKAQIQPVPDKVLQFLLMQRQNSIWRDVYLDGDWTALRRATEQGGDLLYWDDYEWQVDQILEGWAPTVGWTKLRCVQVRKWPAPELPEPSPAPDPVPPIAGAAWLL